MSTPIDDARKALTLMELTGNEGSVAYDALRGLLAHSDRLKAQNAAESAESNGAKLNAAIAAIVNTRAKEFPNGVCAAVLREARLKAGE